MKINNIQILSGLKSNSNSRKQNVYADSHLLNVNSFDSVSFCRKHATKTEIKKLEYQGKTELSNAKKIHRKAQQLEKQGSKLLLSAKAEYQKALEFIKLDRQNSPIELPNGNFAYFNSTNGKDIDSFCISEYNKNNELVREISVKNSEPQTIYVLNEKDKNSLVFSYFDNAIQMDVCNNEANEDTIDTSYLYIDDEPKRILTNLHVGEFDITADEEFEFLFGEFNTCNLGYIEHKSYIEGCNNQSLEKSYSKQYVFNGNKLYSVAVKVDDYGMFGLAWDEALYFKNNRVVKHELDAKQVSANDEPIYINDTPRICSQRIRLHNQSGQYIKENNVVHDSFWDFDYQAL